MLYWSIIGQVTKAPGGGAYPAPENVPMTQPNSGLTASYRSMNRFKMKKQYAFALAVMAVILALFSVAYPQSVEDLSIRLGSGSFDLIGGISAASKNNLDILVLDQNGAVLPGTTIRARNRSSTVETLFTSNYQGEIAGYLDPGDYDLTIELLGFETKIIRDFKVDSDKPLRITVELKIRQIRQFGPRTLTGEECIAGAVTDALGKGIPNAKIELFLVGAKKRINKTRSNSLGEFAFKEIEPGQYRLVVSAEHFGTKTIQKLLVETGDPVVVDVTLNPSITTVEKSIFLDSPLIDFNKTDLTTIIYRRPDDE